MKTKNFIWTDAGVKWDYTNPYKILPFCKEVHKFSVVIDLIDCIIGKLITFIMIWPKKSIM